MDLSALRADLVRRGRPLHCATITPDALPPLRRRLIRGEAQWLALPVFYGGKGRV